MNWVDKWRGRFRRGDSTGSIDRFAINPFALRAGSPTPASAVSAASIRSTADSAVCRTARSEEHTSELQSLMRISYAVFCLKKQNKLTLTHPQNSTSHNTVRVNWPYFTY